MQLSWLWCILLLTAFVCAVLSGRTDAISAAALEGATAALNFCLSTGGAICLWSGVMALLREGGIADTLAQMLRPLLRRLFPRGAADVETLTALSENVSANLLGLGNAATPAGIRAAKRLHESELSALVVLNSASIQLVPATVAAVRAVNGAAKPFDILPQVWITSAAALCAGLLVLFGLRRVFGE